MNKVLIDIVARAKQVADLENSNYISDNEMKFLLNEAYDSVYADLINIGDRYFIKSDSFSGQEYSLPQDFMILSGIWTHYDVPVPRRVNTQGPSEGKYNGVYYDLNKEKIKVYGPDLGPYKVEYYPVLTAVDWPTQYSYITLELPDNICFTYFTYVIACKMKMKQGADFSQIQALALQEFQKYIQLQHRDNFGVTRIGNVYGYGGSY